MNASKHNLNDNKKVPEKQSITSESQHITVKDLASYCLVSTSTVRRWMKDGKLKSIQLPSKQHRISVKNFEDFLKLYQIPIKEVITHRY
jgi:excisionase family DNA binding protein